MNEPVSPVVRLRKLLTESAAGSQGDLEIAQTLRARLILLCGLFLATGAGVILFAQGEVQESSAWRTSAAAIAAVIALLYSPLLLLLWRRPTWQLDSLRAVEAIIFFTASVLIAVGNSVWFMTSWLKDIPREGQEANVLEMAGDTMSITWVLLIVFYGICIPNTGRRCAAVVLAMDAIAVASLLLLAYRDHPLSSFVTHSTLPEMGFWLCIASAIAIYGSQKSSELRKEASEARKLGQYVLKQKLGAGGMGEVYRAEHQLLKRPCAIKLIKPEKEGDTSALERFEREVQATAALTGGNVVDIYDFGHTDDGVFFYVMEYLPGMNLQEFIERHGPMPPERAVHILRQVCWALHEAHVNGLIHRDIKPSNIYLCERGKVHDVVKLLDFGLVQDHRRSRRGPNMPAHAQVEAHPGQLTEAGYVVGTPSFMSPEQINGEELDERSDLYSLGIVAYVLMTGRNPYQGSTFAEIAKAHCELMPTPLIRACPMADVDLNTVIMRCLEKERSARYPTALSLQGALASCQCADQWSFIYAEAWWGQNEPSSNAGDGNVRDRDQKA